MTKTTQYTHGASKEDVQTEFQRQLDFYIRNEFDFVVAEVIVGCGRRRNHCWLACSLMPFGGISLKLSGVCVVAHPLQIDDIMILGSLYCNCKVLAPGIVWWTTSTRVLPSVRSSILMVSVCLSRCAHAPCSTLTVWKKQSGRWRSCNRVASRSWQHCVLDHRAIWTAFRQRSARCGLLKPALTWLESTAVSARWCAWRRLRR